MISKRKRRAILNAISAGAMAALKIHIPNYDEGPDEWSNESRRLFDAIDCVEARACEEINKIFANEYKQRHSIKGAKA